MSYTFQKSKVKSSFAFEIQEVVRKKVTLSDGREIEFDVKICEPEKSEHPKVFSKALAHLSDRYISGSGVGNA